jgi:hypothetical protein
MAQADCAALMLADAAAIGDSDYSTLFEVVNPIP